MNRYLYTIFRRSRVIATLLLLTVLIVYINQRYERNGYKKDTHCTVDIQTGRRICRPVCQRGYFSLPGMDECHPLLTCDEIKGEVTPLQRIGEGMAGIKIIMTARWKWYTVVLNKILPDEKYDRTKLYLQGLDNLRNLQPSEKIVQLIGTCGASFVTELHPLGSAENYEKMLKSPAFKKHDNVRTRLTTCVSYIEAIHFLHNSPIGTRVFCDSSTPLKAMSQFLVTTDLRLIINDVDEIPQVHRDTNLTTTCTYADERFAYFIAPEMLEKNRKNIGRYRKRLAGYDEKTDIWKMPSLCEYFLGSEVGRVKEYLSDINAKCKSEKPSQRPTAFEVLQVYKDALTKISNTESIFP